MDRVLARLVQFSVGLAGYLAVYTLVDHSDPAYGALVAACGGVALNAFPSPIDAIKRDGGGKP